MLFKCCSTLSNRYFIIYYMAQSRYNLSISQTIVITVYLGAGACICVSLHVCNENSSTEPTPPYHHHHDHHRISHVGQFSRRPIRAINDRFGAAVISRHRSAAAPPPTIYFTVVVLALWRPALLYVVYTWFMHFLSSPSPPSFPSLSSRCISFSLSRFIYSFPRLSLFS